MFLLGAWKSIREMEDELTLEELYLLMDAAHEKAHEERKFSAALQGVDIDGGKKESNSFDDVKQRAAAAAQGKTEQQHAFDLIGIEVEDDD